SAKHCRIHPLRRAQKPSHEQPSDVLRRTPAHTRAATAPPSPSRHQWQRGERVLPVSSSILLHVLGSIQCFASITLTPFSVATSARLASPMSRPCSTTPGIIFKSS